VAWILRIPPRLRTAQSQPHTSIKETTMNWTKPEFIDWRFGFEITLYIANR
jgi:pyrroloquinoline quinone biosynthesis protein A